MPLPSERHIRILVLHPAVRLDSPISCTLKEISLDAIRDKKHQYEALSYVWGSPAGDREVTCNKRALLVTENCLLALRYLRRKTRKRLLWVDAICINQESIEERNIQVRLMGDVYSLSKHVLIWLGIGDVQTKMLFRLF
ncbi:hypothetical protein N431DRAFT_524964 [Stipitochalara longipes BDJ]|nr:hypothetical protein N431DRAFT_524964 [Stipitochalara longipes BDJ]